MNRSFHVGWLLACLWAANLFAQTQPAPKPARSRYLFVFDTSFSMAPQKETLARLASEFIGNGLEGQMQPGAVLDLWSFNESPQANSLPMGMWQPEQKRALAAQAHAFLFNQPFEKISRLDKAMEDVFQLIKAVPTLTVLIVSDGLEFMRGTTFDREINAVYRERAAELRQAQKPFVTILVAQGGVITNWSIMAAGEPLRLPQRPVPQPQARLAPDHTTKTNVVASVSAPGEKPVPAAESPPPPAPSPQKPKLTVGSPSPASLVAESPQPTFKLAVPTVSPDSSQLTTESKTTPTLATERFPLAADTEIPKLELALPKGERAHVADKAELAAQPIYFLEPPNQPATSPPAKSKSEIVPPQVSDKLPAAAPAPPASVAEKVFTRLEPRIELSPTPPAPKTSSENVSPPDTLSISPLVSPSAIPPIVTKTTLPTIENKTAIAEPPVANPPVIQSAVPKQSTTTLAKSDLNQKPSPPAVAASQPATSASKPGADLAAASAAAPSLSSAPPARPASDKSSIAIGVQPTKSASNSTSVPPASVTAPVQTALLTPPAPPQYRLGLVLMGLAALLSAVWLLCFFVRRARSLPRPSIISRSIERDRK